MKNTMTFKSKTDRNIVIILIAFLIGFLVYPIICIILSFTPSPNPLKFNQKYLERQYKTEFVYVKTEKDDSARNGKAYYFYPENNPDLIVKTKYIHSIDLGTIVPVSITEFAENDLKEKIVDMVCSEKDNIELSESTLDVATNKVDDILDEIKREFHAYNISADLYNSVYIPIFQNGDKQKIECYFNHREEIKDELEKKLVKMICDKQDKIELTEMSLDEATDKVISIVDEIKKEFNTYGIRPNCIVSVELPILKDGIDYKIKWY